MVRHTGGAANAYFNDGCPNIAGSAGGLVIDSLLPLVDGLLSKLLGARVSARRQGFKAHQFIAVEDSQFPAAIHDPQFAVCTTAPRPVLRVSSRS